MSEEFIDALNGLTDRVIAFRVLKEKGLIAMPLEIKGLGQNVINARKGISDVRNLVTDLNISTTALAQEIQDVKDQVEKARTDLKFEAETLGNSPPVSAASPPPSPAIETIIDVAGATPPSPH